LEWWLVEDKGLRWNQSSRNKSWKHDAKLYYDNWQYTARGEVK